MCLNRCRTREKYDIRVVSAPRGLDQVVSAKLAQLSALDAASQRGGSLAICAAPIPQIITEAATMSQSSIHNIAVFDLSRILNLRITAKVAMSGNITPVATALPAEYMAGRSSKFLAQGGQI